MKRYVMGKVFLTMLLGVYPFLNILAQTPADPAIELQRLSNESAARYELQRKRAIEYALQNNVPLTFKDSQGNVVLLVDVSEAGIPIYKATDNAGAAITTGVTALQSGGALGLNLEGEGMEVGIWDGGAVSHSEYADRILNTQGSEDDHASHVTGTILAAGLNASAKGMAPKAKAYTFNFDNDEAEMLTLVTPDQTSLLLSNHSYGLVTGWNFNNGWQWWGTPGISESEDYRFGFYSGNAAFWDQIAFNAPYYTIVKSAGNDRNNTGNGTRPPDCNGGAGYDCISDVSTSKNIITVGAVNKVFTYTDASSVGMSSFSSWGPTDDGRIKPDLVAAGVGLFSSVTQNNYESLSGTSMATPNTTGSLVLLQELHRDLHGGNFMRASTLKALAIQTTKETGLNPGPDYRFGWGLLDVQAAAKILLEEDGVNVRIEELTLLQGQTFEMTLSPKGNEKITATLVWTDPAGTPVAASLDPTNIMLVNDLDLRIVDDADNIQFPWILDPLDPDAAAKRGDNIRDNVEKIEFSSPEPRNYKLIVSHKGSLLGGSQNFSLILQYTSINDSRTAFYWIGGNGAWSDPTNWSLTSGGVVANMVPGSNDRIFVDENSFSGADESIILSGDVSCGSLTWLADQAASISLNNHSIQINGDLIITSSLFSFSTSGSVRLMGDVTQNNQVILSGSDLSFASLLFDGQDESLWTILGQGKIGSINLNKGSLKAANIQLELGALNSTGSFARNIDISGTTINKMVESTLSGVDLNLVTVGSVINLSEESPGIIHWEDLVYEGAIISNGQFLKIEGSSNYNILQIDGEVEFTNDNLIADLHVKQGSVLNLSNGVQLRLSENVSLESQPENKITVYSNELEPSSLLFEGYYKLCFDNLVVNGVNIEGLAIVNAGKNSEITNSNNWIEENCEDVLFPKFDSNFSCTGSVITFDDETSGIVENWSWDFGDPTSSENTSSKQNPYHIYALAGVYEVSLTVSNVTDSRTYTKLIEIVENSMLENHVIINIDDLFSFRSASSYQWYKDDEPLVGEILRAYNFNGEAGNYFVLTIDGDCNIKSSTVLITGIEELELNQLNIFPNPATNKITISVPNELIFSNVNIVNNCGVSLYSDIIHGNAQEISVLNFPNGVYFLQVNRGQHSIIKKFIVRR